MFNRDESSSSPPRLVRQCALPFVPAAMSTAVGTAEGGCVAPPSISVPLETTPPSSEPAPGDPEGPIDAVPTTAVENPPVDEVAPTTVVEPPATVDAATETTEQLVTPTTVESTVESTVDVATDINVVDTSVPAAFGLLRNAAKVSVDPAPPPRQIITLELVLYVDSKGNLNIDLPIKTGEPDPCGIRPKATIEQVPGLPGRYIITFPALKGRDCRTEDLVVQLRTKQIPAKIVYNDRDEPTIRLELTGPFNYTALDISMKCTVLVPKK